MSPNHDPVASSEARRQHTAELFILVARRRSSSIFWANCRVYGRESGRTQTKKVKMGYCGKIDNNYHSPKTSLAAGAAALCDRRVKFSLVSSSFTDAQDDKLT